MKETNKFEMAPFAKNSYLRFFEDPFFSFPDFKKDMLTNITETEDGYRYEIEIPGFKREEISIELKDNALLVNAEHKEEKEEKDGEKVVFSERKIGKTTRMFKVPQGTLEEDIKASLNNGILTVNIAKKEPVQPDKKLIPIK